MNPFYTLSNPIQEYPWGSSDGIAHVANIANPTDTPMAELWMGDHQSAPSQVDIANDRRIGLDTLIAQDPQAVLGKYSLEKFGTRLPYLFKILSAGSPLSLQVHPSRAQAIEGFIRENALGLGIGDSRRNYRDRSHKPELLVALTPFSALCGFRQIEETVRLFSLFDPAVFGQALDTLLERRDYRVFFGFLLGLSKSVTPKTLDTIKARVRFALRGGISDIDETIMIACRTCERLESFFPNDFGILAPFYLNVLQLSPGQAISQPSGIPHAYIQGTGLELMANSDNVLRGGLTSKHIDIPELLRITEPNAYVPGIIAPQNESGTFCYRAGFEEFELLRINPTINKTMIRTESPSILLAIGQGDLLLESRGETRMLTGGMSFFFPAGDDMISLSGTGTAYIARVPTGGTDDSLD